MNTEKKIIEKLKEAFSTSCHEAYMFSGEETQLIETEYLLTINAAKAICELNNSNYFGEPYKIRLEYSTSKFATACTPFSSKAQPDSPHRYSKNYRTNNNSVRPGKIDIAIYTTQNSLDTPLCAIEVKGFNPSKKLICLDLERNSEYFSLYSPTGESCLPFTVFIALHSYKGVWDVDKNKKNCEKLKVRYQNYLCSNSKTKVYFHRVEAETVRLGSGSFQGSDELKNLNEIPPDLHYQFIGVIVISTKNPTN